MERNVRLLKSWRSYQPGFVFTEMGYGAAQVLIQRGIAEWADSPQQVETASVSLPEQRQPRVRLGSKRNMVER
jgi:hypothetical protein